MSAVVHKRSLLFLSLCDFPLSLPLIRGPGQLCISVWQVYHQTISQLHFRPGRVNRSIWTENCQITYLMHAWCSKHSTWKARLGKHSFKKTRNFMKKFHKTAPPPVLLLWNPYSEFFQKFDRISGTYGFLNKRYEIRLTPPPPPRLWKSFIKFRIFLKECFPYHSCQFKLLASKHKYNHTFLISSCQSRFCCHIFACSLSFREVLVQIL